MNHRFTIRLTDDLIAWLKETSRQTRAPMARIVREHLETAKAKTIQRPFMRHAGAIRSLYGYFLAQRIFSKMSPAGTAFIRNYHEESANSVSICPGPYRIKFPCMMCVCISCRQPRLLHNCMSFLQAVESGILTAFGCSAYNWHFPCTYQVRDLYIGSSFPGPQRFEFCAQG